MILHAPRRRNNTTTTNNNNDDHTTSHHHQQDQPQQQLPGQIDGATNGTTAHPTIENTDDEDDDVDSTTPDDQNDNQHVTNGSDDDEMEPWVDFIRRCTHDVEMRMQTLRLDDWVTLQRQRKWRWARKVTAMTTSTDWMPMVMHWDPTVDHLLNARRRQGRPKTRWCDDIRNYVATHTNSDDGRNNSNSGDINDHTRNHLCPMPADNEQWQRLALDEAKWNQMERGFCQR